ncbi:MAG: histidine phosphatase family protein [Corynebacterium sp.]|nr:histidine phosphatase family protein [Corynebacterium sp.]
MNGTLVHLVRHGEVYNPDKILYGRLPGYHLSARGRSMAAATATSFTGHDVVLLAASPLTRAQETAAPIAEVTGCEIDTWPQIVEAGNDYTGLHIKGWDSALWNPRQWPKLRNPLRPSWGEPYTEIAARMMGALHRAADEAKGHEAILVSHELPVVMVQRTIAGQPLPHNPARRRCSLASVTSVYVENSQIVDMYYSEPAAEVTR